MRKLLSVVLALVLAAGVRAAAAGAAATGEYRNLFRDYLGKSDAEIDAKVNATFQQLFHGDNDTERLYYPVGADMAYIADTGNGDVRSEGMSYGLMIAVQLDRPEEFDRLWTWAKTHMRHNDGPRRGYFAWQCAFDGRRIDPGSASDGEEWIATALFFAAHRWGDREGPTSYAAEAQSLLRDMLHKPRAGELIAMFNREEKQVVFAPNVQAGAFTDPSYHLPAFYELWARWADDPADRRFWKAAARTSREFFRKAAHPKTGLMPEYAHFDGRPYTANDFGEGKDDFRFDAWRTPANVALDHAWWSADVPWQSEHCNRVLRFFASQGPNPANQFTLEGQPLSRDTSLGMLAMAAVAGLAADAELARPFVQRLWDAEIPTGRWRYYDGLLYHLALLQVGGRFAIHDATPLN